MDIQFIPAIEEAIMSKGGEVKTTITASALMEHRGLDTKAVSEQAGLAYNTVLGYKRNSGDRISKRAMEDLATSLGVEVFELFYQGQYARPLIKIAQALGIQPAGAPLTKSEYIDLIVQIGEKVGAKIDQADFDPLPIEWAEE